MLRSLPLLLVLAACAPDDTLDSSSTSTSEADVSTSSTGRDSTSGGSSTSGHSGSESDVGSGSDGETMSVTGGESTSDATEESTSSTSSGVVLTSGGESSTGEVAPICWAQRCDDGSGCDEGLVCLKHPKTDGVFVCVSACSEQEGEIQCTTDNLFCDVPTPGKQECIKVEGTPMCFPSACDGPVDCAFDQVCTEGFCY